MGNGNGNWGSRGCLLGLAIATSACGPGVREFLLGQIALAEARAAAGYRSRA